MKHLHSGSIMTITLVYISLLLMSILGLFLSLSNLIRLQANTVDSIQSSYLADSGLELGLMELHLRGEGYENHIDNLEIGDGKSIDYSINYRTKQGIPLVFDSTTSTKTLALYYDTGEKIIDNNGNNNTYITLENNMGSPSCAKLRLIGQSSDGSYESISSDGNCRPRSPQGKQCMDNAIQSCAQSIPGVSFSDIVDNSVRSSNATLANKQESFKSFLDTHTNVKIEIKPIIASKEDILFAVIQSPGRTIASYQNQIFSTGTDGHTSISSSTKGYQESPLEITTYSVTNK